MHSEVAGGERIQLDGTKKVANIFLRQFGQERREQKGKAREAEQEFIMLSSDYFVWPR
jgi:hypothetical protein